MPGWTKAVIREFSLKIIIIKLEKKKRATCVGFNLNIFFDKMSSMLVYLKMDLAKINNTRQILSSNYGAIFFFIVGMIFTCFVHIVLSPKALETSQLEH